MIRGTKYIESIECVLQDYLHKNADIQMWFHQDDQEGYDPFDAWVKFMLGRGGTFHEWRKKGDLEV